MTREGAEPLHPTPIHESLNGYLLIFYLGLWEIVGLRAYKTGDIPHSRPYKIRDNQRGNLEQKPQLDILKGVKPYPD